MENIGIYHYLFLGLLVFIIGIIGSVVSSNVIKILISIELILSGININFVTFAAYCDNINFDGYIMALFYAGLGAVELAVALYIFYLMYQRKGESNISKYTDL